MRNERKFWNTRSDTDSKNEKKKKDETQVGLSSNGEREKFHIDHVIKVPGTKEHEKREVSSPMDEIIQKRVSAEREK